jgi:ABC-type glycerol-3-phosphate transport system permease component
MVLKFKDNPIQVGFTWIFAAILAIIVLIPFITAIISAFKASTDFYEKSYTFFPKKWQFENFIEAWRFAEFGKFMFNSIFCAILVTVLCTFISSASAFAFARINFFGRDFIFYIIILCQAIPFAILFIPTYILVYNMKLLNTYLGLVLPAISSPMGIFLIRQNMKSIPPDYEYAAMIDGCNRGQMFLHVFLPMTTNTIVALGIFTFMGSWNNYIWPLLIITKRSMYTLPLGLTLYAVFNNNIRHLEWSHILCAGIMAVLPIFVVYALASKRFMEGFMLSGIKS